MSIRPRPCSSASSTKPTDRWEELPVTADLKAKAKAAKLWNLWLPKAHFDDGLTNLDYAPLCEIMGRSPIGPESFNCSAPDTGNMETLILYGSEEQKKRWLPAADGRRDPLLLRHDRAGRRLLRRHQYPHRDPARRRQLTSSTAANGGPPARPTSARRSLIVMGRTDPDAPAHKQQSMVLVPMDTPGVTVVRPLSVFGYDDAPHGHAEVLFENVRVPVSNILLGEGRGFEIAQGRLGPGRIHHCMRTIGLAERALETLCQRALVAHRLRQAAGRSGRHAALDRRIAHGDRSGAAAHAACRADDRQGRHQGRARRDRDDQGGGAEHGAEGGRPRDPDLRRRRPVAGFPPRLCLCARPLDPHSRRARTRCIARPSPSWNCASMPRAVAMRGSLPRRYTPS